MANQGRNRVAISGDSIVHRHLDHPGGVESSSHEILNYTPLDSSVDGMRLLVLEPGSTREVPLRCRLVEATFGQMPKYEALSYTWGNDDPRDSISINGKTFLIRRNLCEALFCLRMLHEERVLWIDAICINQDDIQERNRQVRIMPHVYSRAQMVLVWLGNSNKFNGEERWSTELKVLPSAFYRTINDDFGLYLSKMSNADYWHRVWIVQEIGKARRILVHFGQNAVDWETFVCTMRQYQELSMSESPLPLRLADQMMDKYGDGYKLENLIKTHQNALCQDIRDKIYGFTGLANDTYGRLAMDYAKSPFEVWNDVVRFRNADTSIPQYDILQFAGFARQLLGGHLIMNSEHTGMVGPVSEEHTIIKIAKTKKLVLCPARLWGRIVYVGPTYDEIRGNLRKVDEWITSIREYVSRAHLRSAYEENDLFLQLLEDLDHSDFNLVPHISPRIKYRLENSAQGKAVNNIKKEKTEASAGVEEEALDSDKEKTLTQVQGDINQGRSFEDKFLILLDLLPDEDGENLAGSGPFPGIGIASYGVEVGDYVCGIYQKERAAVVRKSKDKVKSGMRRDHFSIVASAVFPDVRAMAEDKKKSDKKIEAKFSILNSTPLKSSETINLYMGIKMVYGWAV